ncbi:PIN-like domain-containing protein [Uliginosibacterium gangwonense]|uniref:PIN-like domain-containing protein n=1 Tax=Uliginosibacterium gangwonense TaxID=392736 RepID=UPI000364D423|nr:PIN domain-containing protein [Uliginosibacterium gangwonense]
MKKNFLGYYPPTQEQYKKLWNTGLIVLDANVLLSLYRLPTTAREDLLKVLESLKERLWIPHQVAMEFQRNRLTVIASERKTTEDVLKELQGLVACAKNKVNALELDKRNLSIEPIPLLDELEKANNQLVTAIQKAHDSLIDISANDPIREKIDTILSGRVGSGPRNQDELDKLTQEGEDRFANKIPPGFEDSKKGNNPNDAGFVFDHIKYQKKFGDLILWRQLIQHTRKNSKKEVLFVTADNKADWWWREQGKTIGPHPELSREIAREGGVELFWMYSSDQFLDQATHYASANIDKNSVNDIRETSLALVQDYIRAVSERSSNTQSRFLNSNTIAEIILEKSNALKLDSFETRAISSVEKWLKSRGIVISPAELEDPSLYLSVVGDELHIYKISAAYSFEQIIEEIHTDPRLLKKSFQYEQFCLIFILKPSDNFSEEAISLMQRRITKTKRVLSFLNDVKIIIGVVADSQFIPLHTT